MFVLSKEENKICRSYQIPEDSIRKYCINRYSDAAGRIYYVHHEPIDSCFHSECMECPHVWMSDITKHRHVSLDQCYRCAKLRRIFLAQSEFVDMFMDRILEDHHMQALYNLQLTSSCLFGGLPKMLYKELIYINDYRHDFKEERYAYLQDHGIVENV